MEDPEVLKFAVYLKNLKRRDRPAYEAVLGFFRECGAPEWFFELAGSGGISFDLESGSSVREFLGNGEYRWMLSVLARVIPSIGRVERKIRGRTFVFSWSRYYFIVEGGNRRVMLGGVGLESVSVEGASVDAVVYLWGKKKRIAGSERLVVDRLQEAGFSTGEARMFFYGLYFIGADHAELEEAEGC